MPIFYTLVINLNIININKNVDIRFSWKENENNCKNQEQFHNAGLMKSCKTDKGRYKYSIYRQSNEICLETYLEEKETGQIFVGSYNEKQLHII